MSNFIHMGYNGFNTLAIYINYLTFYNKLVKFFRV